MVIWHAACHKIGLELEHWLHSWAATDHWTGKGVNLVSDQILYRCPVTLTSGWQVHSEDLLPATSLLQLIDQRRHISHICTVSLPTFSTVSVLWQEEGYKVEIYGRAILDSLYCSGSQGYIFQYPLSSSEGILEYILLALLGVYFPVNSK